MDAPILSVVGGPWDGGVVQWTEEWVHCPVPNSNVYAVYRRVGDRYVYERSVTKDEPGKAK